MSSEKSGSPPAQAQRPISLLERFCLVRELIGFPHNLTALTTYPLPVLPSHAFLTKRICALQEHYPALYATVIDRKTRKPKWQAGERPWDVALILEDVSFEPSWGVEEIMRREMARFAEIDLDKGLYWQVRRYVPASGSGNAYIALSTTHVLTDGMAMLRLSEALLSQDPPTAYEPAVSTTLSDKEQKAGLKQIIPIVWREVLWPGLPRPLRRVLPGPKASWPLGDPSIAQKHPIDYAADYSYLPIPAQVSNKIKALAQSQHASFHIVLKVALLISLWRTLQPNGRQKVRLKGLTPRDERSLPSHTRITGVFPSLSYLFASVGADTDYWSLVDTWSKRLRRPVESRDCKRQIGTLAYIPDSAKFKSDDPRRCTGWEDLWLDKIESPGGGAVEASLELSNITKTKLPPGATDFAWVQPPFPIGAVVQGSIVGHEGGLRLVICWREGFCITREQVKRLEGIFLRVLDGLISGTKRTAGELTSA